MTTQQLCRKILRTTGISSADLLGQGKTCLTFPPCIWRAKWQGCAFASSHEGWPPSSRVLGKNCKGLRTKLSFLILIKSVVIIFTLSFLCYTCPCQLSCCIAEEIHPASLRCSISSCPVLSIRKGQRGKTPFLIPHFFF